MAVAQFDNPLWLAFLLASLLLAITPGPGVLFIVSRTLAQGRRAGLVTVAGVALGNCGNALGAGLGLAALFSVSAVAFTAVKFAGVCYLFYLGWQALQEPARSMGLISLPKHRSRVLFKEGFWVALLNPKTTLFFAAFLPQFMDLATPAFAQSLFFGMCFVFIAAMTDSLYVLAAALLRRTLSQVGSSHNFSRYGKAAIYMGLGLFAAFSGHRTQVSPTL